jgi:hypothetical protein
MQIRIRTEEATGVVGSRFGSASCRGDEYLGDDDDMDHGLTYASPSAQTLAAATMIFDIG